MQHLSMTQKRWQLRGKPEANLNEQPTLKPYELVTYLFHDRKLHTVPSADRVDPFVIPDMPRAVKRIQDAIKQKETIGIFGDYDCDGVTSATQLVRYFRRNGIEPHVRLPHRVHDGYGLNMNIIDECIKKNMQLLITVDTGITAAKEIEYARSKGLDVIVTDHHHVPEELPVAVALIHPALSADYPEPHPSGAGVVYQLLHALEGDTWREKKIDTCLAMMGTVADLVELRGSNRSLAHEGIEILNNLKEGPLNAFAQSVRKDNESLTSIDIAFRLIPRINAAGRIADATLALDALLEGGAALEQLHGLNTERQHRTSELQEQASKRIGVDQASTDLPLLLADAHEEYHPGIVGLIAGRLTESFGKPSLIAHIEGDVCTASLRSPPVYNITNGLDACSDLLLRYGGHAQAAGCTFLAENFTELCTRLNTHIANHAPVDTLVPTMTIDAVIDSTDIALTLCDRLTKLAPYGQGNPEPRFMIRNVQLKDMRQVGAERNHLQARVGNTKAIGFHCGQLMEHLHEPVDIVCRIGVNTWQGKTTPQIFIDDIRTKKESATVETEALSFENSNV